jgi:hypothetical protein
MLPPSAQRNDLDTISADTEENGNQALLEAGNIAFSSSWSVSIIVSLVSHLVSQCLRKLLTDTVRNFDQPRSSRVDGTHLAP